MPSNSKYVCVPCRLVFKQTHICPTCGESMKYVHPDWRAPKRNNNRAWRRVEKGEWLWDRRASRSIWRGMLAYHKDNIIPKPHQKKGQHGYLLDRSGSKGPDVDLGG